MIHFIKRNVLVICTQLVAAFGLITANSVHAADISMSAQQQLNLGVSVAPINQHNQFGSRSYPAEITVPVGQTTSRID